MKSHKLFFLFTFLLVFSIQNQFAQTPAFPGAEGYGKYTTGGRGGKVIKVTTLNDGGAGSLRAAVQASGARTVVFEVSGTIELTSDLKISNGDITIAGQTAPGDGICIKSAPVRATSTNLTTYDIYGMIVSANNVIIRYIRFRPGDDINNIAGADNDMIKFETDAIFGRNRANIIIDHCSMSWCTDEAASFYDNENFTMQWCLISESLYAGHHPKGNHGYGGIWGGQNATFHHNLLADHTSRNPRFCGARYTGEPEKEHIDHRNNVIFNWGGNSAYAGEGGTYNIVNNYYKRGPATSSSVYNRIMEAWADASDNALADGTAGKFYVNGNYISGSSSTTEDNWKGMAYVRTDEATVRSDTPFDNFDIPTQTAEMAFEYVLANVGATLPARDAVDQRIIQQVVTGDCENTGSYGSNKGIIDTPSDVGGYPVLNTITAPLDSDNDGMPDAWETARGLAKNDASDRNGDDDSDGYTNLEEYLNELVEGFTFLIRPMDFAIDSTDNYDVILSWNDVTDNEDKFIVECMPKDGEYEVVAELEANTTSYVHTTTAEGIYYYRIKALNSVDTSLYTEEQRAKIVIEVGIDEVSNESFHVYPNPVNDQINIVFPSAKSTVLTVSLLDVTGKQIKYIGESNVVTGHNSLQFDMSDVASGMYILSMELGNNRYVKQIVKY